MSTEKPNFPALPVQAHLAQCLECREFQRRLLLLQNNVPRIPLPPTRAKEQLLQQILQGPVPAFRGQEIAPRRHAAASWRLRAQQQWRQIAVGLAAAVVLVASGIWLGNMLSRPSGTGPRKAIQQAQNSGPAPGVKSQPDPFNSNQKPETARGKTLVAKVMECDLKLAGAQTPRQRVEALAELANVLQRETVLLITSAGPAELNKLAGLYKQVIQDGVLPRARELPMDERRDVLSSVTAQLGKAKREAEQLAQSTPRSAEAMQRIAAAARQGDQQLRELMQESLE
jgi:hypothetical protein